MRLDVPGRYTTRASYDILWMLAAPCVLQQDRILVLGDASVSMTRIISFKETPMVESRSVWMRKGFVCGDFATGSTFTGLISAPGLVVENISQHSPPQGAIRNQETLLQLVAKQADST